MPAVGRQCVSRRFFRVAYALADATACGSVLLTAHPLVPTLRELALDSLGSMAWLLQARPVPKRRRPTRRRSGAAGDASWHRPCWLGLLIALDRASRPQGH